MPIIYRVKVIALETWDLLTLRDKNCLACWSVEKDSCISGQSLREKVSAKVQGLTKGTWPCPGWKGAQQGSWEWFKLGRHLHFE